MNSFLAVIVDVILAGLVAFVGFFIVLFFMTQAVCSGSGDECFAGLTAFPAALILFAGVLAFRFSQRKGREKENTAINQSSGLGTQLQPKKKVVNYSTALLIILALVLWLILWVFKGALQLAWPIWG